MQTLTGSSIIDRVRALAPTIQSMEAQIEHDRTIPPELADALWDIGVFRAQLPKALGGLELHPTEYFAMTEELAHINGSVGWLAFPNSGQTFAALQPAVAQGIFASEKRPTIGGSNGRNGKAVAVEGGYLLSGRWSFVSGSPHCTWLFGTAHVYDGDQIRTNPDASRLVRTFFLPASQATILDTWHAMGMRGTGSHDYVCENIFIPDEYVTDTIFDGYKHYSGPIYQGHFVPLAQGAVALGLARATIDAFTDMASSGGSGSERARSVRDKAFNQLALAEAVGLYKSSRVWLHAAATEAYDDAEANGTIRPDLLTQLKHANIHVVHSCVRAVDRIWEAAGPGAVFAPQIIERCFRDLHTCAQHMFVVRPNLESVGSEYFDSWLNPTR